MLVPLQERSVEGAGEQRPESQGFGLSVQVCEHQFDVAAELPEDLAAGSAGRRQYVRIGDYGHSDEVAGAFRDGLEDGDAFGANGQAVGGVFDIAAGENAAGFIFDRGAYLEL